MVASRESGAGVRREGEGMRSQSFRPVVITHRHRHGDEFVCVLERGTSPQRYNRE